MRVAATLQQADTTVTLAFPGIRWVEFAPGGKQLILLAADLQTVLIPHIKINARHVAAAVVFGFGAPQFEVHFKITLAVHARFTFEHAKAMVGTVTVQFADRRHQVVQVGLHAPEQRIIFYAVFAPAVLPALALMAKLPGRYHMLPLQPRAALSVFARHIATAAGINLLTTEVAVTIKG